MKEIYKPSEKSGNLFTVGLLLGTLCISLATMMYVRMPLDVNNLLFSFTAYATFLMVYIIIVYFTTRISKCRNIRSARLFSILLSIYAVYFNWYYLVSVILSNSEIYTDEVSLFFNPLLIFYYLGKISKNVYDTVFGLQITGWIVWLFWIIEACGILALGYFYGKYSTFEQVFCEECKKWATLDLLIMFKYESEEELQSILDSDINDILTLTPTADFMDQHILININKCKKCDSTITLNIDKKIGYIYYRSGEPSSAQYQNVSPVYLISLSLYNKFAKIKEDEKKLEE